jgi:hypothetical protein
MPGTWAPATLCQRLRACSFLDNRPPAIRLRYPRQFSAPSFGFVSRAFKMMGYSRDSFYRFKESSTSKAANWRSKVTDPPLHSR